MCGDHGSWYYTFHSTRSSFQTTSASFYYIPKALIWKDQGCSKVFSIFPVPEMALLHYDESKDVVFCHTCVRGFAENKVTAANADTSFVSCLQFLLLAFHDLYKLTVDIKIISCVKYLARQGMALRGDGEEENSNL